MCVFTRVFYSHVIGIIALFSSVTLLAAGPGAPADKFPDYHPAHTVIKCPYLPADLKEIPLCGGERATCVGTDDADLILGTDKPDVIVAGAGNDVVHGDADNDIVCGGPGNDSLMGARGYDRLFGESGDDWLFGAPGDDELNGGEGDYDVLWGGPGFDNLNGGPGKFDVCLLQREMVTLTEKVVIQSIHHLDMYMTKNLTPAFCGKGSR